MNKGHIGISQEILISDYGSPTVSARRLYQYIASLAATLGALSCGMAIAWSSSAGDDGKLLKSVYGIEISPEEFSWISSLVLIGAGVSCIPIGFLVDFVGRKYSMLIMVVPFTIGWLLIIFANSVTMFYVGRLCTGLGGGAFGTAAPIYITEIAENDIRGSLTSYFHLLFMVGVLLSYAFACFVNIRDLSIISAVAPLASFVIFLFMPESPTYYLKQGNEDSARKSLTTFRGTQYDIEDEIQNRKQILKDSIRNRTSFLTLIKTKAVLKSLVISYGLMIFQQFSGINFVTFYATSIFEKANTTLNPGYSTIIVGIMQVLAVSVTSLVVDRVGRRILLLTSYTFLCITSCILGIYFYLTYTEQDVSAIKWLPLTSVCLFIVMYNIGAGPLAWSISAEIFALEIKGVAASSAALLNCIVGFLITKFYNALPTYATFWVFSVFCAIGIFFAHFVVPETKGKSLEQIQKELNGS